MAFKYCMSIEYILKYDYRIFVPICRRPLLNIFPLSGVVLYDPYGHALTFISNHIYNMIVHVMNTILIPYYIILFFT